MNDLIDPAGHRLYLTASERAAFLAAAARADREALLQSFKRLEFDSTVCQRRAKARVTTPQRS